MNGLEWVLLKVDGTTGSAALDFSAPKASYQPLRREKAQTVTTGFVEVQRDRLGWGVLPSASPV